MEHIAGVEPEGGVVVDGDVIGGGCSRRRTQTSLRFHPDSALVDSETAAVGVDICEQERSGAFFRYHGTRSRFADNALDCNVFGCIDRQVSGKRQRGSNEFLTIA